MSFERQQAHQRTHSYAHDDDHDMAPGRESISSRLTAPTDPIESGLLGSLSGQEQKAPASTPGKQGAPTTGAITVYAVDAGPSGTHERTTIGVGEVVNLETTTAGDWTADAGTASARSKSLFRWTAPDKPGPAVITYASAGKQPMTTKLNVIGPDSVSMKLVNVAEEYFRVGDAGVIVFNRVTLGPASASFGNVEVREVPGGPSLVVGCFERLTPEQQRHKPPDEWTHVTSANQLVRTDVCGLPRRVLSPPFSFGMLVWQVPWHYRVIGTSDPGTHFTTVAQVFTVSDRNGIVSVSKGGATASRAATSKNPISVE